MGPLDRANLNHWTDKPEEEAIDSSSPSMLFLRLCLGVLIEKKNCKGFSYSGLK
jgi:hypothetical protein